MELKSCRNKVCTKINPQRTEDFYSYPDGKLHAVCKICFRLRVAAYRTKDYQKEQNAKYRQKNRQKLNEVARRHYYENKQEIQLKRKVYRDKVKDHIRQKNQQYYIDNSKRLKLETKKHRQNHPEKVNADSALKRARKRERTPKWLTKEHKKRIEDIYKTALEMTEATGVEHHVDHIVPLCGENVSGLHLPWNLQILTVEENMKKYNKF